MYFLGKTVSSLKSLDWVKSFKFDNYFKIRYYGFSCPSYMMNRGEWAKIQYKSIWNTDTTNQMTSLVSSHLISGNHTLNSGNGLCKQIGPGPFPGDQSTQMLASSIKWPLLTICLQAFHNRKPPLLLTKLKMTKWQRYTSWPLSI